MDGTDLIVIDYEGMYCDQALKEIAGKVGGKAEWWVEGQTVNVCRCEHGEEITLGYGKGLTSLERDTSNTAKFYTRLFPVGSTRNIDAEKYGSPRLMLPGGRKYIEQGVEEYGIYDHYEQAAFSGIYPRRVGTVSSVRSEEVTDEEGKAFTVYYFKDGGMDFDPNDYELAGETKRVSLRSSRSGLTVMIRSFRAASSSRRPGTPMSFGKSGCRISITGWQRRNLRPRWTNTTRTTGWISRLTRLRPTMCGSRGEPSRGDGPGDQRRPAGIEIRQGKRQHRGTKKLYESQGRKFRASRYYPELR